MSRSFMRHVPLRATFVLVALTTIGALVACAQTDEGAPITAGDDAGANVLPDGATNSTDASDDATKDSGRDASRQHDAAPRTCSDDNFCHSVLPENSMLRGVWGDGQGVVWAVSAGGSVLRWDGSAWNEQAKDLGSLKSIWGSGPTDLWILNDASVVYHGTGDNPATITFEAVTLPGDASLPIAKVWGTGPSDVWAVGGAQDFSDFPWPGKARVLHMTDPAVGFVVDDELTASPTAFEDVWGSPESGVWLHGEQGFIRNFSAYAIVLHRAAGSTTWETVEMPENPNLNDYAPFPGKFTASGAMGGSSVWLAGETSGWKKGLYHGKSSDNGKTYTWSFILQNSWDLPLNAFWGVSDTDLWAVGKSGRTAHWNGTKWQQAAIRVTDSPIGSNLYGIWGTSSTDFWVVGDDIAMHKTTGDKP
ncbi:hypothetical protein AKJ09_03101 [Labilithrix luteola]|uniref:Type IV fimbrial biogenesis protein PilY1 n=1 Tax=Labilithrix luteola TaxID=1391654 RepID=A0A0K1PSD6_9BACT|nr:hypothetical protein [Labilithrix luteola]AKU96437.1 hypothetical protein AKJ09_03101 [Labilithrix luteola]